ncbi:hypothetical protein J6590_076934 [Homalodisca vitripennis]|nr:hypothetical protein J6590_076934 [Homalodisca vitripennis]
MNDKNWTVQQRLLSARRASQMAVFDNEIERWGEEDVPYLQSQFIGSYCNDYGFYTQFQVFRTFQSTFIAHTDRRVDSQRALYGCEDEDYDWPLTTMSPRRRPVRLQMSWFLQIAWSLLFAFMLVVAIGGNIIVIWIVIGTYSITCEDLYFSFPAMQT